VILYAISDRSLHPDTDPLSQASALLRSGVDWVQVREKDLPDVALFCLMKALAPEARRFGAALLLNGRPDIALMAGATGVHLPAWGLPVAEVRKAFGSSLMIVKSCHSPREVVQAGRDGADAAVLGPVFDTPSKSRYGPPVGLDSLKEACTGSSVPVLGLGGIDASNAAGVLAAGASGIAAIRLFCEMPNPIGDVPALRARLSDPAKP
jgi:thiamine-phosphate pyrophosphorylase